VLLDEWQEVPGVFGAARRAVDADPRPSRFLLTGSVRAEHENEVWPGTGRFLRLPMYPMTVRERIGDAGAMSFVDKLADGGTLAVPADTPDLRGYVELGLESGFPQAALLLSGRARRMWLRSYLEDLLTHDVEELENPATKRRDTERLRRYFEAYALNSAGAADHKTIFAWTPRRCWVTVTCWAGSSTPSSSRNSGPRRWWRSPSRACTTSAPRREGTRWT
jgi:predicted AAA+ superfamily ATPase